jgi:SAM-dependent methyltransferase
MLTQVQGLGWAETEKFLVEGVVIACENSSSSVTISGDVDSVNEVVAKIQNAHPDKLARALKVDKAYHSHHMKKLGFQYHQLTKDLVLGKNSTSDVVFFSSVSGKLVKKSDSLTARYWQSNLESPVLFRTAVANFLAYHGERNKQMGQKNELFFLEVGPHSALAGPLRQILAEASTNKPYASMLVRGKHAQESFLEAVGQLYCQNVSIDFTILTNPLGHASVLTDLDPYPYHHEGSFIYESRLSKEWRLREFPKHELLGVRVTESTVSEPCWRNMFHLRHVPWVSDHNIKGDVVFPCAGYIGMVGEAISQLTLGGNATGKFAGFALRGVSVKTAMVLNDVKPTEIVTSLRRYRLTEQLDSVWYDFTVSSQSGNIWLQHCSGQVRAVEEPSSNIALPPPFPRKVDSHKLYRKLAEIGANYGPYFQGLTEITSATNSYTASGKAIDTIVDDDETVYPVHPTKIDFFLQLSSVSDSTGVLRKCQTMRVPTGIEEITVLNAPGDLLMTITTSAKLNGQISGDGQAVSVSGDLALTVKGLSLSPLEKDESKDSSDPHAAATLEWQPDVDFLDASKLILPITGTVIAEYTAWLKRLNVLCSQEALSKLSGLNTDRNYLKKYRSWLETQVLQPPASEPILPEIQMIVQKLLKTPASAYAICMMRILENIGDIFSGRVEVLELLMAEKSLTELYNFMSRADRTEFFRSLGHSKPCLRILEVGAGTGGTTTKILQGLVHESGHQMYAKYTFTDISAGFFAAAQDRLKDWPNIEYKALDITTDPAAQGFELGTYDLVIATNVLHATPNLQTTLTNVRKLLAPGGRLFMEELCCDVKATNFIFGTFEGWWLGAADGRESEPYVSPERWELELRKSGFAGLDAVVLDSEKTLQLSAIMIAKPSSAHERKSVAILCDDTSRALAEDFGHSLGARGIDVSFCNLESGPPADRDILAVIDVESPFFYEIEPAKLQAFQDFVSKIRDSRIFWLTPPAQNNCQDPRFAQSLGAIRCIRSEFAIDFATCEIDHISNSKDLVLKTFEKFLERREEGTFLPEYEYSISNGAVNIGRFYPFVMKDELVNLTKTSSDKAHLDLTISKYGRLGTLQWTAKAPRKLEGDEVEINMKAVGMNFKV